MRNLILSLTLAVAVVSLSGCSLIDDHFDCCCSGVARDVECRLHPYTGIDSLLAAQVTGTGRQELLDALISYYHPLLYPSRHTVSMTFLDAGRGDSLAAEQVDMEGTDQTFGLHLPEGTLRCVAEARRPLYGGRALMPDGESHSLVDLYPADAQVALVATVDSSISQVEVWADSLATAYSAKDSAYTYASRQDTLHRRPEAGTATRRTYAATVLPSQPGHTWSVIILATTATGSLTRTVLTIRRALLPADIRVLQVAIDGRGAALTTDAGVGASVTLDWKKGGDYNTDI